MSPIGVGFFAGDADGLFHSQRLQLMGEVRTVAHGSVQRDSLHVTEGSERSRSQSLAEFLGDPEVSLVWIPADRNLLEASVILQAGKDVLLGVPSAVTSETWRQLITVASTTGRSLIVAALHRWDGQFQTVRSQIKMEELGAIVELRRISRQFVPGELCASQIAGDSTVEALPVEDRESRAFHVKWFEMLDELLLLVPSRPTLVWARRTTHGRMVWVTFADGCQACLELDRRSLAPLETGWIVEWTAAGYAAGRRFQAAGDYELVDVPVQVLPTNQDSFYNSVVATVRDGEPFPVTADSILQVLMLRDAIDDALRTGEVVDAGGI